MKRLYKNIGVVLMMFVLSACSEEVLTENDNIIPGNPNPDGDALPPNEEWAWVSAYPGEVNNSFQRLTGVGVTVKGNYTLSHAGLVATPENWQSTGLYVPPAELVTVTVPEGVVNLAYRIGVANVEIKDNVMLKRSRSVSRSGLLTGGENSLHSNFGGNLYLYFEGEPVNGDVNVMVDGAVKSMDYVLNETNLQEWKSAVSDTVNPMIWGELIGKRIILTLPAATLRKIDNPKVLLEFYEEVLAKDFGFLSGVNESELTMPWRFYSDIQLPIETGSTPYSVYGHYPMGFNSTALAGVLPASVANLDKLAALANDQIILGGLAGLYQTNWGNSKLLGSSVQKMYAWHMYQRKNQWSALGITMPNGPKVPGTRYSMPTAADRMTLVLQLAQQYGWGLFSYCSEKSRKEIPGLVPDQYKNDLFAIYASEYTNSNLTDFFGDWDFPVSCLAKNYMKNYPEATDKFWNTINPSKQPSLTATSNPGTSYPKIVPVKDTVYDRSKWTVKVQSTGEGAAGNIVDGKPDTYWHSNWGNAIPGSNKYPHELVFLFEEETTFNYLYFVQRPHGNPGPKSFVVLTKPTPDAAVDDWQNAEDGKTLYLCRGNNKEYQYRFLGKEYTAYGVKILFTECLPRTEDKPGDVTGYTALSEFGTGLLK